MTSATTLHTLLNSARIAPEVFGLRPDYRALLIAVDGISPVASDATSEALLVTAEEAARSRAATTPLEEQPHIVAWRDAYRAFGAKPQRTRPSAEALIRRAESDGLPRINRLTDTYNAISVLHQIPLGGEDLSGYVGAPALIRATGAETFEVVARGELTTEHPAPGEVVWTDDAGVTCRRWNWRQTPRTALTDDTTSALFILDALDPLSTEQLRAAADDLITSLLTLGQNTSAASRLLHAGGSEPAIQH